jgi:hypothetical protein
MWSMMARSRKLQVEQEELRSSPVGGGLGAVERSGMLGIMLSLHRKPPATQVEEPQLRGLDDHDPSTHS